jgi:hypothetical protein
VQLVIVAVHAGVVLAETVPVITAVPLLWQ